MKYACVAVLLSWFVAFAQTTPDAVVPAASSSFGMVGVASGQVARLTVLNSVRTPPPVMIPQLPCRVNLSFYNAENKLLKEMTVDNLGFGRAASLDFRIQESSPVTGNRLAVGGVVKVGPFGAVQRWSTSLFCSVIPTLEIIDDATGKTTVVLSAPALVPTAAGFRVVVPQVPEP